MFIDQEKWLQIQDNYTTMWLSNDVGPMYESGQLSAENLYESFGDFLSEMPDQDEIDITDIFRIAIEQNLPQLALALIEPLIEIMQWEPQKETGYELDDLDRIMHQYEFEARCKATEFVIEYMRQFSTLVFLAAKKLH